MLMKTVKNYTEIGSKHPITLSRKLFGNENMVSLSAVYSETRLSKWEFFTEVTICHFCDSGHLFGHHWQENM